MGLGAYGIFFVVHSSLVPKQSEDTTKIACMHLLKVIHKKLQKPYTVQIVHGCRSPLLEKDFCSIFLKIPGG